MIITNFNEIIIYMLKNIHNYIPNFLNGYDIFVIFVF